MDTLRRLFLRPRTRVTLRQSNYYHGSGEDDGEFGGDDDQGDYCALEEAPQEWGPPKDANVPEVPAFGLLEAPRRAQKIEISYARTAKKVDIKALKDDLWESIDSVNPGNKKGKSMAFKTSEVATCVCVCVCV